MSTGVIIILVLLVVAVAIAGLVLARKSDGGRGLRRRFGPEYERAVAQHNGDTKAAEHELGERVRRHGDLKTRPLSAEAHTQYSAEWAGIQEEFVDAPAKAVAHADELVGRVARDRGFPADEHDDRIAALSVHHPHRVDSYRRMHTAAHRTPDGQTGSGTEELREVLLNARDFFEELLGKHPGNTVGQAGQRSDEPQRRHTAKGLLRRHDTPRGSAT